MATMARALGQRTRFDATKACRLLGWTNRPAEESVIDTARSLIQQGLLA
jgi:nucleoside-diphosphate-sugar epimerase